MITTSTEGRNKRPPDIPERILLDLTIEGLPLHQQTTKRSMQNIIKCLKNRRPELLFPFFLTHADVDALEKELLDRISVDDVLWYLRTLRTVLGNRYPDRLHWMERSNLYHTFGLLRLVGEQDSSYALKTIGRASFIRKINRPRNIIDISAQSTFAIFRELDASDMIGFAEKLHQVPDILRFYGSYQIYYYGGVMSCINGLLKYASDSSANQIFLPQTVLSLLAIQDDIEWHHNIEVRGVIRKQLYDKCEPGMQRVIWPLIKRVGLK